MQYLLRSKIDSRSAQSPQTQSRHLRRVRADHVLQQAAKDQHRVCRRPWPANSAGPPAGERREAVAKDVRQRAPQFSAIPAHDQADALDVPERWRPGNEWSFTRYAPIVSIEEHAQYNSPASELVHLIEDAVSAERFQQLLKHSEPLDESDDPSFEFLTKDATNALRSCFYCFVLLIFYRQSPFQPDGKKFAWCMSRFFTVRLERIPPIDSDRSRQTFSIQDKHLASISDGSR